MKLKYKGVMSGFFRYSNGGGFSVRVGQIYDIPKEYEKQLLVHPDWEKVEGQKEFEEEVEDKKEKKTYNKKY